MAFSPKNANPAASPYRNEMIRMSVNSNVLVPMTEANQNFSKVIKIVEENGMAVILKDSKPRFMIMNFTEYNEIQVMRQKLFDEAADSVIAENLEALIELAK